MCLGHFNEHGMVELHKKNEAIRDIASLDCKVAKEVCNPIDFDNLRIFGCPAFVHMFNNERSKLDHVDTQFCKHRLPEGNNVKVSIVKTKAKTRISTSLSQEKQMAWSIYSKTEDQVYSLSPLLPDRVRNQHSTALKGKDTRKYTYLREIAQKHQHQRDEEKTRMKCLRLYFPLKKKYITIPKENLQDNSISGFRLAIKCQGKDRWMGSMMEEMESLHKNQNGVDLHGIATNHFCHINELKTMLSKEFDIKDLGLAKKILRMDIHMERSSKRLWLSQQSYVEKVLDKFGMSNTNLSNTPLTYHFKLTKHIDVRFHKSRKLMTFGQILLKKVHTFENATNMLINPVTTNKFKHCLDLLNISHC
uniref:Retrovirus-related Pol polyprotein from transposon TNT 1-94 n=1 Tax=Cajanus cajan TaxID=3821 RepID=A0A151TBR9_CAJCA|nr:Retrovirus-related Pol polyprotein from transposon TNT 1-94 [Cajanus cajan]